MILLQDSMLGMLHVPAAQHLLLFQTSFVIAQVSVELHTHRVRLFMRLVKTGWSC
jgi:hypothetical protein